MPFIVGLALCAWLLLVGLPLVALYLWKEWPPDGYQLASGVQTTLTAATDADVARSAEDCRLGRAPILLPQEWSDADRECRELAQRAASRLPKAIVSTPPDLAEWMISIPFDHKDAAATAQAIRDLVTAVELKGVSTYHVLDTHEFAEHCIVIEAVTVSLRCLRYFDVQRSRMTGRFDVAGS